MFIGGLFDLLLYFNDDNKIKSSFTFITNLLLLWEQIQHVSKHLTFLSYAYE